MRILYGLTTYNRLNYLKKHIKTWCNTINSTHKWTLIICDDGSTDGSIGFIKNLKIKGVKIIKHFNKRRGVHFQINQILKDSTSMKYDYGFRAEDDIFFLKKGWDDLYIRAIRHSGLQHLVYFNKSWKQKIRGNRRGIRKSAIINKKRMIQTYIQNCGYAMGAFWTFTPKVIGKIGFIDVKNFGLCGQGHIDYTKRCCLARFNRTKFCYDAYKSEKYVAMIMEKYRAAKVARKDRIAKYGTKNRKFAIISQRNKKNLYVPYAEFPFNMNLEKIKP